jgi:hypothetical protein
MYRSRISALRRLIALTTLVVCSASMRAATPWTGEPVNGFPSWSERLMLTLANRSRSSPSQELAGCPSGNCPDAGCYAVQPPLGYDALLNHSSRFHSDEMFHQSYFDHPSHCVLPGNIASIYPASCNGSASCACNGGTYYDPFARMGLFGRSGYGEIIAVWSGQDPIKIYYLWMYEATTSASCGFTEQNGHRYLLLTTDGVVGFGNSDALYTGDFALNTPATGKIASGAHDPQIGPMVDFWANWYDAAGPKSAALVLDGVAYPLTLERGSQTNGAWHTQLSNLGTSCHRYYYQFTDSTNTGLTFPGTGSYGVGAPASCPDWSSSRTVASTPDGDTNGDGIVNVSDVFYLVSYLYSGGPRPIGSGDVNGDGKVDAVDVFYLINYLFAGGPAPK